MIYWYMVEIHIDGLNDKWIKEWVEDLWLDGRWWIDWYMVER